jgi:hypothetical protein
VFFVGGFQPDGVGESKQNVGLKPDLQKAFTQYPVACCGVLYCVQEFEKSANLTSPDGVGCKTVAALGVEWMYCRNTLKRNKAGSEARGAEKPVSIY